MAASPNLLPWFETARCARLLTMRPNVLNAILTLRARSYSALMPVSLIMPAQASIEALKKAGASANATVWGS